MSISPSIQAAAAGRYIALGQSGDAVNQIQERLLDQGIEVSVTGRFDAQTLRAVRTFQASHDCSVDGIVGPQTLVALGGFDLDQDVIDRVNASNTVTAAPPASSETALTPPSAPGVSMSTPQPILSIAVAASATVGSGRAFMAELANDNVSRPERENRILDAVANGDVPQFLTQWVDVPVSTPDGKHTGVMHVAPDYFSIGSNDDYVRMPMTPGTAQAIADQMGAVLPTAKMVDTIYGAAAVKLAPQPMPKYDASMMSSQRFLEHNALVQTKRDATGQPLGALTSGDKKDLIVTNDFRPGKVAIYGWSRGGDKTMPQGVNGRMVTHLYNPIQPVSTIHEASYADYSHGVRLVKNTVTIDGEERSIASVLADPELSAMLSDEGPIKNPRVA